MDYNENEFKAKANIKARRIWLVFALLLSANYGTDVSQGGYPSTNFIIFLILCWVPFFAGDLLLRIRGKADDRYRYALVVGYGIFYTFLICTTDSPIAFTYILPVVSLLVLYKDRKFMVGCAIANIASVIISVISCEEAVRDCSWPLWSVSLFIPSTTMSEPCLFSVASSRTTVIPSMMVLLAVLTCSTVVTTRFKSALILFVRAPSDSMRWRIDMI